VSGYLEIDGCVGLTGVFFRYNTYGANGDMHAVFGDIQRFLRYVNFCGLKTGGLLVLQMACCAYGEIDCTS
jgi:hypothetical protein